MANAYRALDSFTALGDPTRRAIFERVAAQPSAVGDLARGLPVSRPAVSQHLKVLKEAGLVSETAEGTRRIYRMVPHGSMGWTSAGRGLSENDIVAEASGKNSGSI